MANAERAEAGTRVTVTFDDEAYRKLVELAKQHRISRAWIVRRAVDDFLGRHEGEQLELALNLPSGRQPKR